MSDDIDNMDIGLDMEHEYSSGFDPLPEVEYMVEIDSAEIKNNKKSNGRHVKCALKVISDDYNGRLVFVMFNIENDSPKAVEIGRGEMKKMMQAAGIESRYPKLKEIMNKRLCVKLGLSKEKNDKGQFDNVVKVYKKSSEFSAVVSTSPSKSDGGDDEPPW